LLSILDRYSIILANFFDELDEDLRSKGIRRLGILSTYICQILGKDLAQKRQHLQISLDSPKNCSDTPQTSELKPKQSKMFAFVKANNVSKVLDLLKIDRGLANLVDHRGRVPLHYACELGFLSMIEILLDHGSSTLHYSKHKCQTPVDLAFQFQSLNYYSKYSQEIIKMMEAADENVDQVVKKDLYYRRQEYYKYLLPID
jgi:ankyrin repeat protein